MVQTIKDRGDQPTPTLIFDTLSAYQRSAALRAAIELDIFTAIAEGNATAQEIAKRSGAADRGVRILCDYLTMMGFVTKQDGRYGLTRDSAVFLDRRSPAYVGDAVRFLGSPLLKDNFDHLTEAVRRGGTARDDGATVAPDNPIWVEFARGMANLMRPAAQAMAEMVDQDASRPLKVLDIAAGHGVFGIAFAKRNPNAEIYAVDWPGVLQVASENASAAGVSDRHHTFPGSAFEVEFGDGYDIVLLTNFLHHFDAPTNEALLKKVHKALREGGRVATLEFVPNDDRISPEGVAGFSLVMLAGTPGGDAYTFKELDAMLRNAGFARNELRELPPMQRIVLSYK